MHLEDQLKPTEEKHSHVGPWGGEGGRSTASKYNSISMCISCSILFFFF